VEVVEESIQSINQSLIPRTEQDRTIRAYQSNFIHLKSEISLLEKNDFAIIKQENERIASEVEKLKSKMRDDLQRLQAGVRLDMNLDKARVRDEQNALLSKIKQTESKLETEIGQMRAAIENVRWDTIKTIGAAGTSIGLVVLAWARYFKM
jgi:multidrug resistance efflux pump